MTILKNIVFTVLLLATTSVAYCQQPAAWSHPIFKAIEKKAANIVTFSHRDSNDYYIPLAVLNKTTNKLYYTTTFGAVFDSIPVGPLLAKELASHKTNAFDVYTKMVTVATLNELEEVKNRIRTGKPLAEKLDPHKTYLDYSVLKNDGSTLEQIVWLDNMEKYIWQQQVLLNMVLKEKDGNAFTQKKTSYGFFEPCKIKIHSQKEVVGIVDMVEFTPCNRFSNLDRAVLRPANNTIYVYNKGSIVIDSFTIKKEMVKDLSYEKEDVFALYRLWLERQLENVHNEIEKLIPKKTASFKGKAPLQQEKSIDELLRLDTLISYARHTQQKILYTA
jgi:hypothetical protein